LNLHLELIQNQFATLFIAGDPIATQIYQLDSVQTIEDAKLIHYGRNLLLDSSILSFDDIVLNGSYLPAPESQNAFHRSGVGNGENTKWLSENGFHEFVIRENAGGF